METVELVSSLQGHPGELPGCVRNPSMTGCGWCGSLGVALGLRLRGTLGSTGISGNPGSRAEAGGTELVQTAADMDSCNWVIYVEDIYIFIISINKQICETSVLCIQLRTAVTKCICEVRDVFCFMCDSNL